MRNSICCGIKGAFLIVCLYTAGAFAADDFRKAYTKGANARVAIRVLDETGSPVSGAKVDVFFDMVDRAKGCHKIGFSDTNGVYVAESTTKGVLELEVTCEGYYRTRDEISFIDIGREYEVRDGKWQPWGMTKEIGLRQVLCPVAIRQMHNDWKDTPIINEWIGFDLQKYDFVNPVGKGETADFEVKFDWDRCYGSKHNGMAVSLRFPSEFSGGYYVNKKSWSDFRGVYRAQTNEVYVRNFRYERWPIRDAKGRKIGGCGNKFDQSKLLIVRSRCVVDDNGHLISAHYAELSNLEFSCTPNGEASLKFGVVFNPIPNDTNLEPK